MAHSPPHGEGRSTAQRFTIGLTVNGRRVEATAPRRKLLSDFLKEDVGLTGVRVACEHGVCGACTILVDGRSVRACLMLAVQADGAEIRTVEGLAREIVREARFSLLEPDTGWSFMELARRHGDYALVSVATVLRLGPDGSIGDARIALGSVADRAVRCPFAERMLAGERGRPALFEAAATAAAAPLDPPGDVHGSGAYRPHLAAGAGGGAPRG